MGMKVKKSLILFCFVSLFIIFSYSSVFALGLAPAKREVNFEPGYKFAVTYIILTKDSNQDYEVYAEGFYKDYVKFDQTIFTGSGSVTAYVTLPEKPIKYGPNNLYIRIKEINKEIRGVSTILDVGALIRVHVPYPGKYAEISKLRVQNVNENEPINLELVVSSRGDENITVNPWLEFYSDNELIDTIELSEQLIPAKMEYIYEEKIDSTSYPSGIYNITAYADYGPGTANRTIPFRIGTLFVDIINYTEEVVAGKINPFEIEIESKWNSDIDKIYALVELKNQTGKVLEFKTPPTDLKKWESDTLKAYLNAENLNVGEYETDLTLFYEDATTKKQATIKIIKARGSFYTTTTFKVIIIAGGSVLLIIILLIIYLIFRKRFRKKQK